MHGSADVSEFRLRILIQRSASPFAISNAVRDTWLSTGPTLWMGQIADYGRAASQADCAGDRRQIIPFGAVLAPFTGSTALGLGNGSPAS